MNVASAATSCTTCPSPFASRCADLLGRLGEFAKDAAKAVAGLRHATPAVTTHNLTFAFARLAEAAARLIGFAFRLDQGHGFPPPRSARSESFAPRDEGLRDREVRVPFSTLFQLGVPGADALRNRLAALLADPDIAAMIATEPAIRRAAAPIARALGLTLAPCPAHAAPVRPAPPIPVRPAAPPPPAAPAPIWPAAPAPRIKRHWFHDRKRNKRRPRAG